MRALRMLSCVWLCACSTGMRGGDPGNGGNDPPPDAGTNGGGDPAWSIAVDMSATDRFATGDPATWPVSGSATASLGLAGVSVAGAAEETDPSGAFSSSVPVARGLTVVPVVARDVAGNERKGHRSVISADYAPEGAFARDAAALVLTDALVASMSEPLTADAADIDVAAEILARPTLSVDDRCVTWPVYAEQGPTAISLQVDGAELWLNVRVPDLYVAFDGECDGLFSTIPIAGEMWMTIDAWTRLDPRAATECLRGFDHTPPWVELEGFYFDVWGTGGPLQGWLVELSSSGKAVEVHDQFQSEFAARADELLGERLADVAVFDRQEPMDLFGRSVDVRLCLGSLAPEAGSLVARIASTSSGTGDRAAPGAPQLGGAGAAATPGELLLDADFVGRLLFSSWRAGGLTRPAVAEVEFSLLSLLARDLIGRYPDDSIISVSIDGELPPVVSASTAEGADLRIDIGDLMLILTIGEDVLFRFGARVTMDLDLVPMDGGLVPTVVAMSSEVHLLHEIVDGNDGALESAVESRLGDSAASLLGGAKLGLPEIPGLGAPLDVAPDAGGRYLRIRMQ